MKNNDSTYKSISEVAKILNLVNSKTGDLTTHTLRFWERSLNKLNQKFLLVKEDIMIMKL